MSPDWLGWLAGRVGRPSSGSPPPASAPPDDTLDAARTYLHNVIELSEDAIIAVDGSQRITLFNSSAGRIFGYAAEDVLGCPLEILLPPRYAASHHRQVEGFAASPDVLRPMNARGLVAGRRKDGGEFPAEAAIAKFSVQDATVMLVRLRDVTARRRAEEGLARLAALVASSEDAITGASLDGTIETWNAGAKRLYGYTEAEAIGTSARMLVPADRLEELEALQARIRRGESITQHETVRLRKDGSRVDVSLSLSPVRDAEGTVQAMSAIARDITERKRLEAQMRRAQKMEAIGTLAGGIAHDFNNLLSAMLGYAEMAADDLPQGSAAAENLRQVFAAGKRAKELIRQILTFSRKAEPTRRPVQLHAIVREALQLLRASLPATVEMRHAINPSSGAVLADAIQMHQVLMNLCANAEHAMRPAGGVLEVRLEPAEVDQAFAVAHPPLRPGPHLRLTVRDTGHGMEAPTLERIFDPFFTTKEPGEGTGMGLSVVHGIVTDHGGAVLVESAPQRGTRFQIYLPRCGEGEAHELAEERLGRGGRERILVVDDEASLAYLWSEMLQRAGYHVSAFTSSLEALEHFQASPDAYDLAILDQTMPELTGERLARELVRRRPELPVILCSGVGQPTPADARTTPGVRAFLPKPIARRDLLLAVQRVLDGRNAFHGT